MIPRVTGSRPRKVTASLATRAALYGVLSKDIGRIPVPAKFGKATQRPAERDRLLRERAESVFSGSGSPIRAAPCRWISELAHPSIGTGVAVR